MYPLLLYKIPFDLILFLYEEPYISFLLQVPFEQAIALSDTWANTRQLLYSYKWNSFIVCMCAKTLPVIAKLRSRGERDNHHTLWPLSMLGN